jgi:hypothetical protein
LPTFCRHNRFLERCPICSKTLPGSSPRGGPSRPGPPAGAKGRQAPARGATRRSIKPSQGLRVHREDRAQDDGYRSELAPGLRASSDARGLAEEIAFASGRLLALGTAPPSLYGEVRRLAETDLEQATWACFLIAYLSPLQGEDPFAGIRKALGPAQAGRPLDGAAGERQPLTPALDGVPLGPRTSHDPARGIDTLLAYWRWVEHAGKAGAPAPAAAGRQLAGPGGAQARAFRGDPQWSPQRRFGRLFERLSLPGFGRMGRYDLLVTLGRLGLYELRPDSLHLAGPGGSSAADPTTLAAKRLFAIGDPLLLERRAVAMAEAISVPVETLDLALANWASPERATLGVPADTCDRDALARAGEALGI